MSTPNDQPLVLPSLESCALTEAVKRIVCAKCDAPLFQGGKPAWMRAGDTSAIYCSQQCGETDKRDSLTKGIITAMIARHVVDLNTPSTDGTSDKCPTCQGEQWVTSKWAKGLSYRCPQCQGPSASDAFDDDYIPDVNGLGMTPLQEFFAADDSLNAQRTDGSSVP
jgi:hypothetical protein